MTRNEVAKRIGTISRLNISYEAANEAAPAVVLLTGTRLANRLRLVGRIYGRAHDRWSHVLKGRGRFGLTLAGGLGTRLFLEGMQ